MEKALLGNRENKLKEFSLTDFRKNLLDKIDQTEDDLDKKVRA